MAARCAVGLGTFALCFLVWAGIAGASEPGDAERSRRILAPSSPQALGSPTDAELSSKAVIDVAAVPVPARLAEVGSRGSGLAASAGLAGDALVARVDDVVGRTATGAVPVVVDAAPPTTDGAAVAAAVAVPKEIAAPAFDDAGIDPARMFPPSGAGGIPSGVAGPSPALRQQPLGADAPSPDPTPAHAPAPASLCATTAHEIPGPRSPSTHAVIASAARHAGGAVTSTATPVRATASLLADAGHPPRGPPSKDAS